MQQALLARDLIAVVDIGSNSVRLVISDRNDMRPGQHLLNEKVMCQLSQGLVPGKALHPARKAEAENTLRWFAELCSAANCKTVLILATAALRSTSDAPAFKSLVQSLFKADLKILSGEDEARTAAIGVAASLPKAKGLVADLGGGSLDISILDEPSTTQPPALSLPLGTLVLRRLTQDKIPKKKRKSIHELIQSGLENQNWAQAEQLILVGGTWRALAQEHMRQTRYPLKVVHRYEVNAKTLAAFCKRIARMEDDELDMQTKIVESRRAVIREASAALEALIQFCAPKKIVFSSSGVREGFLHQHLALPNPEKPEVEAAKRLVVGGARFFKEETHTRIGEALFDWSAELRAFFQARLQAYGKDSITAQTADDRRFAACELAEFGWSRHPSYKAEETASLILHSNRLLHSHVDRAYLALCLFRRYGGQQPKKICKGFKRLLPGRLKWEANVLGMFIRVAMAVSSAVPEKLKQTELSLVTPQALLGEDDKIVFLLQMPKAWEDFPLPSIESESLLLQRKHNVTLNLRFDL